MPATGEHDAAALLASPVRRSLVEVLEQQPVDDDGGERGLTAAELALQVGLHVSTVRFHLDQLVAAGVLLAEFRRRASAGRPRKVYRTAGRPLSQGTEPLRLLTRLLAEAMTASVQGEPITPDEAGRRWAREHLEAHPDRAPADSPGAWLGRVGEVIDVLEEWGYQPEVSTSEGGRTARVELTDCPFLDLARDNQAVVCGVHRGLIAEAMNQMGEADADVTLEPFVAADRCRAHIRTTTPFRSA